MNPLKTVFYALPLFFFLHGAVFADDVPAQDPVTFAAPSTIDECMKAADWAWKSGDFNNAVKIYLIAVKLDPENSIAYQNLAGCYFRLHRMDEAKEAYGQCLAINPDNPDVKTFEAQVFNPASTPTPLATEIPTPIATPAGTPGPPIGQLSLSAVADVWDSNFALTTNGWELLFPVAGSISLWKDVNFYALSEFANGNYINQASSAINLTNFSDTTAGAEIGFKLFGLNSVLNVSFNIPTGNPAWESETAAANIPEEFVDDRYQGRGFGVSGLYGVSIPIGDSKMGVAGGYMYAGDYNPYFDFAPAEDLKLGDSIFATVNLVSPMGPNESQIIQLSGFDFLPTQENGQNFLIAGPNVNLSYAWSTPGSLSFETGTQIYLQGQTWISGAWSLDSSYVYGPRIYFDPNFSLGDFNLAGQFKYILANGYSGSSDPLHQYDGGGYLLGVTPSLKFKMGGDMVFKVWATYDYINHTGGGFDANGNLVNVYYDLWTLGMNYIIPF